MHNQTCIVKTWSGANRLIEVATEIVSRPDATTNNGPFLSKKETNLMLKTWF